MIVVGIEFGAVVRSDDGGKTWSDHRRARCAIATPHLPRHQSRLGL
jgi:photosystem II stability/assembly factor-like uncharacterized protein